MSEVTRINGMAANAEQGEQRGEAVHDGEQDLDGNDAVYDAREQLLGEYGMLLHELGEVVQAGGWWLSLFFQHACNK